MNDTKAQTIGAAAPAGLTIPPTEALPHGVSLNEWAAMIKCAHTRLRVSPVASVGSARPRLVGQARLRQDTALFVCCGLAARARCVWARSWPRVSRFDSTGSHFHVGKLSRGRYQDDRVVQEKAEREKRVREAQIRMRADLDAQLQVVPVLVAHICTGTGPRLHWLSLPAAHESGD